MVKTFKYARRTGEEVQRRAKQSSGRYDSYLTEEVTWFKPRPGENCIRLLPWLSEADPDYDKLYERWDNHWGIDNIIHRNVGPDNGTYLCLDKMLGELCPICDAYHTDDIDELRPADRVLAWLIDRNDEKSGPQLWNMPLQVSKDISAASQVKGSAPGAGAALPVDHPDEGYDIFFDREGEKERTRYLRIVAAHDSSPLAEDQKQQDRWLSYALERRLPDLLKYYPTDYLEKILSGQQREPDEPEENTRPSRSRRGEASDDREDTARGNGADREASRRRPAADDAAAEAQNEAAEAREYSHRRRVADAEAVDQPRERRRPSEPESEPRRVSSTTREKLSNVGRRGR